MTEQEPYDGSAAPIHAKDPSGWRPGDIDYFVEPPRVYTEEEHETWRKLYARQMKVLPGRAISQFMDSLKTLGINGDRVPDFAAVNAVLQQRTGWQIVPVTGIIPVEPFFELLANRRFPVGNFIRTPKQFDYIQEPDVFHDLFGHVPLLADPVFADYIEAYGKGGMKARTLDATKYIGRLYWYTVEFGLIREKEGLRIYGAGILSSPSESVFSLEDASPNRIAFNIPRMMRTHVYIDDMQDSYFVIDSFKQLLDETVEPDFTPLYEQLRGSPVIFPKDTLPGDDLIHKGTGAYAREAQERREARKRAGEKQGW